MTSRKLQALVLAAALAAGYGGAAAFTALAAPSAPAAPDFGPGDGLTRYVVAAADGSVDDGILAELSAVDGVASAQPLSDGRALVATDDLTPADLATVGGVASVEPSPTMALDAEVTDPLFGAQGWHLENTGANGIHQYPVVPDADIDAGAGWDVTRGAGVVVAVIDSGFDSDHPDLAGSLWANPAEPCGTTDTDRNGKRGDCHGWNWYSNSPDIDNGSYGGHGAMVSGSVGARAGNGIGLAGVAPEVTIMPLVVGGGSTIDLLAGIEAIRYAVDHGADVINASWGGAVTGSALTALRSAVDYAASHDVLVVASAGNDSADRDTSLRYPGSLTEWNVITVGASTASDTVSSFSAFGAASVDLFAPGSWVTTTTNTGGYEPVNGTSFSAPIVAGAVALYRAARPEATAAEIKQALLDDVDPVPAFAGRSVTGGRLTLARLTGTSDQAVRYAFTSMTGPAGTLSPRIGISSTAPGGEYAVALGLGMEHEGEIWALADKPVTLGGATVPTDDTGSALFDLGTLPALDGLGLSPSVPLANGRYVLTVQLLRDGSPVGRATAAPLLVRDAGTTPGGPGSPGGSTPAPGTTTPVTPTPGSPGTGSPGTGTGTTPAPGGSTPGGGSAPSTPAPSTPRPTATPSPTTSPRPTTTPSPTSAPRPTTTTPRPNPVSQPTAVNPAPSIPMPGTPAPVPAPAPGPGGTPAPTTTTPAAPSTPGGNTTPYPSLGDFRITSLSPNTVSVGGGTLVTVTGTALPTTPDVLIGGTARATVVTATTTRLQFRVPARVAGVYDVTVFARDGRNTVLEDALTYRSDAPPSPDPVAGTTPGTTPGSGSTPPGATPAVPTPTTPATGSTPAERTGPNGERLVRSATFAALRGIWSVDCSASCTGVAI